MEYQQAREKFVISWGELGVNWGINKTMGQIHALLLISKQPLCCETIMKELKISRGNANMNLRKLLEWKLAHKRCEDGCRREFFTGEKDILQVFKMITKKRKEKELEPLMDLMHQVSNITGESEEILEFNKITNDIEMFSSQAASALERLINSNSNFLLSTAVKLMR